VVKGIRGLELSESLEPEEAMLARSPTFENTLEALSACIGLQGGEFVFFLAEKSMAEALFLRFINILDTDTEAIRVPCMVHYKKI
jgi:hypothetical protein